MDIGMIVRERDCIAEIVMCSTGTRQWMSMMTTTSTIEDNNMKGEQWTRDRVSIAEDAQIRAQHESGHELSTARASAACSMAWPRSTKTRSPRLSIAEDALIMAQLSGSTCDSQSSTARASTTCSMATLKPGSRILETEPESLWRLSGHTFTSTARAYIYMQHGRTKTLTTSNN